MADSVADIYRDGSYAAKNPSFGNENTAWKARQIIRMMEKHGIKPRTICEIGCGSGGILDYLHRVLPSSTSFTGVEPMPEAFAACSQRSRDRLIFRNGAASEVEEVFDLVLLLDVFEHVENYMGFLRSLRRLGKQFIFHIPLDMNTQMVFRDEPIMRVRHDVGHLHYFSKSTALATLRDSGYKVEDWFYSDTRGSAYTSWRTRLMALPRRILMSISADFAVRLLGGNPMTALARPASPPLPAS